MMRSFLKIGLLLAISILQVSCSVFGIRSEENPKFDLILADGEKEIRSYSPYIVAKTTVNGEFKDAQGTAFRILAGYIFGANEKKQTLSMTAPVTQSQSTSKSTESEKLAMTAPVVQTQSGDGWVMTFMMPSKYKMADLPIPKDKRIVFEEVPSKVMGAIRYSGRGREDVNAAKAQELREWIVSSTKYEITSAPSYAGFDPPWTIPLFRRNEMMFELKLKK